MIAIGDIHLFFWLTIGACLVISFLFSGVEAGLLSINPVRFRHKLNKRERGALALRSLLMNRENSLLTVAIVTKTANILAIALITNVLVEWLGNVGYLAALGVILAIYPIGLELLPKALFGRFPYRTLVLMSKPLQVATTLLHPFLRLFTAITAPVTPTKGDETRKLFGAREDLKYFTVESERAGALTPAGRKLIHSVIDFRDVTARELMQPLADFATVPPDCEVQAMIAMSHGGTVERFLAVSATGHIVGLVNVFEAMLDRRPHSRISTYIRRLTPVTLGESASSIMRKLRTARTPVALVMDEEGQPVGIVLGGAIYRRLFAPVAEPVLG